MTLDKISVQLDSASLNLTKWMNEIGRMTFELDKNARLELMDF
jgi:hypothetical protein